MIRYYGIFQLVDIIKEDETKKDGTKVVYFKAADNTPGKAKGYIKFFKVYGKQGEYLLKNLRKKENGVYASRKLYLDGYIETYTKEEKLQFEKIIEPESFPSQLGKLYEKVAITFPKKIERDCECFIVTNLEFADSKDNTEEISIASVSSNYKMEDGNKGVTEQKTSDITKKYKEVQNSLENSFDYNNTTSEFNHALGID